MRIEKLSGDKVKVTLTTSDLLNLDIDINTLSPDSKELHTFLFHIMETIREETGFNPYNGQVVVEATPSRDGISILVSKMGEIPGRITKEELKKGVKIRAKLKKKAPSAIFYFEIFEDLCLAIMELSYEELMDGGLYRLGDAYCYIIYNPERHKRVAAVMAEFSSKRSRYPMQLTYIKEHGSLVARGAELVKMADNIRSLT